MKDNLKEKIEISRNGIGNRKQISKCYTIKTTIVINILQFEKAHNIELWIYLTFIICGLSLYYLGDYFKSVMVCLRLDGPRALPFIGNAMMILDKNSK